MQKVEGSSPFSRSSKKPYHPRGFSFSGVPLASPSALGRTSRADQSAFSRGRIRGAEPLRPMPLEASFPMATRLEEITYEAGREALADQEALVAGIRQRTGTLLAAHALVTSFLGATTIREAGLGSGDGRRSPHSCSA